MRKEIWILILFLICSHCVYASCSEGQIDINTASTDELDKITYVGPATANNIISSRPFSSVDELIKVNGIGEIKLEAIKNQGLVCVSEVEIKEEVEENKKSEKDEEQEEDIFLEEIIENKIEVINPQKEEIKLSPQIIKTEKNNSELRKNNYAIYGLVVLCFLLAGLFLAKKIKTKKEKNEFE